MLAPVEDGSLVPSRYPEYISGCSQLKLWPVSICVHMHTYTHTIKIILCGTNSGISSALERQNQAVVCVRGHSDPCSEFQASQAV